MSSLALMRLLEGAPDRYDAGMRLITFGRADAMRRQLAEAAVPSPGRRILDIGCGTGAVTMLLLERGATVFALDQNPAMLEQARARVAVADQARVHWFEKTASEIGGLGIGEVDGLVASFSLCEMSRDERRFVMRVASRLLTGGGVFAIADEVRPAKMWQRALHGLLRIPQAMVGWLVAGSVSKPLSDIQAELDEAGFTVRTRTSRLAGRYDVLVAEKRTPANVATSAPVTSAPATRDPATRDPATRDPVPADTDQ